ncbi:unnamed protein product [Brassica oleracea]
MRLEHDCEWDDCVVPHMESMESSFGRRRLFEESYHCGMPRSFRSEWTCHCRCRGDTTPIISGGSNG